MEEWSEYMKSNKEILQEDPTHEPNQTEYRKMFVTKQLIILYCQKYDYFSPSTIPHQT